MSGIGTGSPTDASNDVCPKRFGLNYDPPSIVVEYLQLSTGKLFHRRIGLRRLRQSSDPARVAEKLRQRNLALLADDRVPFDQIVTLVTKLQESLGQATVLSAHTKSSVPTVTAADVVSGSSQAELREIPRAGASVAAVVHQGDTLDKLAKPEVSLRVTITLSGGQELLQGEMCNPSDTFAMLRQRAETSSGVAITSLMSSPNNQPLDMKATIKTATMDQDGHVFLTAIRSDRIPEDLNKLSTEELDRHKAVMDVDFLKNQKKPGDADFVYDMQVDFPDTGLPSGWDSEEDSGQSDG